MSENDSATFQWRKSSYSGSENACVEVAEGLANFVPVRDSKYTTGPIMYIAEASWSGFIDAIKNGSIPA
jgi:hypothetical protein